MTRYIDKDALVAEIERRINAINLDSIEDWRYRLQMEHDIEVMKNILSLIGTLEVKEVDLEKEIDNYISDNFFGSETLGFFAVRTKEEPNDIDMALCAKHFFELGLKAAQKGE